MALTVEQVHAAADALDAEGARPTLAAVRKRLGSGSFTTISEAMGSWRTARKESRSVEPLPDAVADRIAAAGRDVWAAAVESAEGRIAGEREALAAERAELLAIREEAVALADDLTAELDEQRSAAASAAEHATQTLAAARAERDQALAETGAAREKAQSAAVQSAELQGRVQALVEERDRLAADLAEAQQRIGRIEAMNRSKS